MKINLNLLFAVVLMSACGTKEENKAPSATANQLTVDVVVGIASIEPEQRIVQLTTESAGVVETIHTQVSAQVKKGELLFTLSDDVEVAQVNQAQSKLHTQQSIIESQRATVRSLEVQVQNASTNYIRMQKLFDGQAATQQQFQSLLDRKHIRASRAGTVLSIEAKEGNYVTSTTVLGEFAPEGGLVAITEIDELFADRLKIGQRASLRPQGDSTLLGSGEVFIVSPYLKKKSLFSDNASNLEDRRVREVRVKINPEAKVLIGSRVECVIELN